MKGGRLPVHVRFLLDEFANIGTIPAFDKLIATIRSREISACVILQTQSQLKNMYKDNAETIIGNMDSRVFLGGSEKTTLKDLSESLGKETIDLLNHSVSKGNSPSFSQNYQKLGKELMDASLHLWFGDRKATLHLAIDDATGIIAGARFEWQETLRGYYHVLFQILTTYGIPYMFYTDRRTVFEYRKSGGGSVRALCGIGARRVAYIFSAAAVILRLMFIERNGL
jgi:hypothetical protein